jgi:hypothetical protein
VLKRALRGGVEPGAPPALATCGVLARAIAACATQPADRAALDEVLVAVERWVDGEVASVTGAPDPTGTAHRMAGVTGSMDLLVWAVDGYLGDVERDFLVRIAELGQIVDDWLDLDKDAEQGRRTPASSGHWTDQDIAAVFARAGDLLGALADGVGEPDGPFRELLVRTFRGEVQRMAKTLVDNP